jgi:post-segregation antitoxin (ccd killing protein)
MEMEMTQTRKQNVTVSLSVQTIRKARILAVKRSTSISGLLAEQIEALVGAEDSWEAARRSALSLMEQGFHLGGVVKATRDELHAR